MISTHAGVGAASVRDRLGVWFGGARWTRRSIALLACACIGAVSILAAALPAALVVDRIYFDHTNLPDLEPLNRFDFSTIGHVYDVHGQPLVEFAREHRQISRYEDIPPIVRDAILAAEDKRFFSHSGVSYASIPRALVKVRVGVLVARLLGGAGAVNRAPVFPQGGSTITQQLVRGRFLQERSAQESGDHLRHAGLVSSALASLIGGQSVNMLARKQEEIRISLWVEEQMRVRFGSKRRAKEEILARYVSLVYMGNGQYGFATAAEYYFGRPLSTFTADDADKAALLAGIPKAARYYAPTAADTKRVLRRRDQILALMAADGFISRAVMKAAELRPLQVVASPTPPLVRSSAVVDQVLDELKTTHTNLGMDDLLQGHMQVYSTVDARVQRIVSDALEHGLERYEQRHASARGIVQGSIVVLKNRDGSILAETGGRQTYLGRVPAYGDFNRARQAMRQPGSAMKPLVYLAAFRHGGFTLDTLVPDEPISLPDARSGDTKWISNYDGRFRGLIPIREALAESRNAVAIWITEQIGIDAVLRTARSLGVTTPLQRYATTALGASEVSLLELATAYRTIASGVVATPHVIRRIVADSGEVVGQNEHAGPPVSVADGALFMIQEGLRGVVRIPTGTAHALDSRAFPIAVMGKTGTTNDFRDALFVGSTHGMDGVTVAVRIGFDDNRSLGREETGGRVALPIFREIMLGVYRETLVGPVPVFPDQMEQRITRYLQTDVPASVVEVGTVVNPAAAPSRMPASPEELEWFLHHGSVVEPNLAHTVIDLAR